MKTTESFLFSGRIHNCYDSHVHWRATGGFARKLSLHHFESPLDVLDIEVKPENYAGPWLLGFGWDQNKFEDKSFPNRIILDKKFGDTPVYFVRIDGHAAWVNTAALKLANLWQQNIESPGGGKIILGDDAYPTGVFIDLAMRNISQLLPTESADSVRADLLAGQKTFHEAGFTHIRDLTCDDIQWQVACALEKSGELKMAVEQFFSAEDPEDFGARVTLALKAKAEDHTLLKPKGVKVYFDGALGSEGALLSESYRSGSGRGLKLLTESQLTGMMAICFKNNLDIAVHAIGDEAAHIVAQVAWDLKSKGLSGCLHIEHAELLRLETISLMQKMNVICHMQPCHWLSDKKWLSAKIGKLAKHAFRWHDLEKFEVPFYFGSDSPIEKTSVQNNISAILDAAENGILAPQRELLRGHTHPDGNWCLDTSTEFQAGKPVSVMFCGEKIY